MKKKNKSKVQEREVHRVQWDTMPSQLHAVYDDMSTKMTASCLDANRRHNKRVSVVRTVLVMLFLVTVPFSIKALTRDYPYEFMAQNKVEMPVGVIENLDSLVASL